MPGQAESVRVLDTFASNTAGIVTVVVAAVLCVAVIAVIGGLWVMQRKIKGMQRQMAKYAQSHEGHNNNITNYQLPPIRYAGSIRSFKCKSCFRVQFCYWLTGSTLSEWRGRLAVRSVTLHQQLNS